MIIPNECLNFKVTLWNRECLESWDSHQHACVCRQHQCPTLCWKFHSKFDTHELQRTL